MRKIAVTMALIGVVLASCSGDGDEDDAPPPPPGTGTHPQPVQPVQPPGQVMVTVIASSTPSGAMVTGGGRQLGPTPLQTQVPVPAPVPGQVQTFAFTFALEGYQTATINASPVNNTISITAALAPLVPPQEVAVNDPTEPGEEGDEGGNAGPEFTVQGNVPDPRIYDNHDTVATAVVNQSCIIERLRVRLVGNHTFNSDLVVSVRGPGGRYTLQNHTRANPFRSHTVRRARGDQAQGRWTLVVSDTVGQDSGTLRGWSLSLQCRQ